MRVASLLGMWTRDTRVASGAFVLTAAYDRLPLHLRVPRWSVKVFIILRFQFWLSPADVSSRKKASYWVRLRIAKRKVTFLGRSIGRCMFGMPATNAERHNNRALACPARTRDACPLLDLG